MQQSAKKLSDQLNKSFDEMGMPHNTRERAVMLSKMLQIPKPQAWGLLDGHLFPDEELARRITSVLEVNLDWLHKQRNVDKAS